MTAHPTTAVVDFVSHSETKSTTAGAEER